MAGLVLGLGLPSGSGPVSGPRGEVPSGPVVPPAEPPFVTAIWGQSEPHHILNRFDDVLPKEALVGQDRVTFWWHDRSGDGPAGVQSVTLNDATRQTPVVTAAMVAMANTFMRQLPGRDIRIVMHTQPGTTPEEIMDDGFVPANADGAPRRRWQDDWALDAAATADGFAVAHPWHSWFAAPSAWAETYGQTMVAFLTGRDPVTGAPLSYSEAAPLLFNGIAISRTLRDLYPHAPAWIATPGAHVFAPLQDLRNAVTTLGGTPDFKLANIQRSTESWRAALANPALAGQFGAPVFALNGYANGRDAGDGTWTDHAHPDGGTDAGINRMARLIAHAILRGAGVTDFTVPRITDAEWQPDGSFMEFWSDAGPITTARGGTGPRAGGPELAGTPRPGTLSGNGVTVTGLRAPLEVGAQYLLSYELAEGTALSALWTPAGSGSPFAFRNLPRLPGRYEVVLTAEDGDVAAAVRLSGTAVFRALSIKRVTALPHWADMVGVEIDGVPAERVEIRPDGRVRVSPNGPEGARFTKASVVQFGRGGASGWVRHDADGFGGLWDDYPIVDVGLPDLPGVPLTPLPDPAVLRSTVPGATAFRTGDAGPYFVDPAGDLAPGTSQITGLFVGAVDADQAASAAYVLGITGLQMQVQILRGNGALRLSVRDNSGDFLLNNADTAPGLIVPDTQTRILASVDLVAGYARVWLGDDPVPVLDAGFTAADPTFQTAREVALLANGNNGANQLKGVVERVAVWFAATPDGTLPDGAPYKDLSGDAATVNGDAWRRGAAAADG